MSAQLVTPPTITVSPFIDGRHTASTSTSLFTVKNPSTGQTLMDFAVGSDGDADLAVMSSKAAFEDGRWSDASPSVRKNVLYRFAALVESESKFLDALDAEEMGKPVSVTAANAMGAASLIRYYAEAVDKVTGDVFTSGSKTLVLERRVPRGVVGCVVPWNFPTYSAAKKIAPALAAGNSVVLKPSELSSRSALRLAQLAMDAGLPPGVLNVVPGRGDTVGAALGLHPNVDMITFTGSTDVGKKMLEYSGRSNMKAVLTECGGKSPQIVFDDVDIDAVASATARFILLNQGQVCSVGSRLVAHRGIEEALVAKVIDRMKDFVVGDALSTKTTYGPLASEAQFTRVMGYIASAKQDGAELVVGGTRLLPESAGYFVAPTVFRGVRLNARIAREEVFGPVLSVMTFDGVDDAISIANATRYGLVAYVWTTQLRVAMRMAKSVRSPIYISTDAQSGEGAGHAASHEPYGQSGVGVEGGLAGLESYLRRQTVSLSFG